VRAMWVCAAVATLSGWVWSVATPYFQVPDEIVHVGYVHYLGETGKIPGRVAPHVGQFDLSEELASAVNDVPFSYQGVPDWSRKRSDAVHRALDGKLARVHEPEAGAAANNPPLYYLLEAIPYRITRSANLFDRIMAMRLFSSLFLGATAAFSFLFVRELLPRTPWAWTVAGMAVALQPLAGFIAGGVNPDSLLWAACAALFWQIAVLLRRGLTVRRAAAVGIALSAGLLTKAAMFAMVPGALLALAIGAWRLRRVAPRRALAGAVTGLAACVLPFLLWVATSQSLSGGEGGAAVAPGLGARAHYDLAKGISYIWQLYLPTMPFLNDQFPGYPLWNIFFQGFVGRYGYFFYGFPNWVNQLGLAIAVAVIALAARHLWVRRGVLRRRLPELLCYVVLTVALLLLVGIAGFRFKEDVGLPFEQTRYLFLILPLYGALVAVAARGAGRYARQAAVLLVAVLAAHEIFSVLLTLKHYYS
jgi:4-amino-4-deoxy-L-arabinose transferase-like glycosyltransferase